MKSPELSSDRQGVGRVKSLGIAACAIVAAGFASGWFFSSPPTELVFLSVGQGDCTLFRHKGTAILVDAGPRTQHEDAGKRLVVPKLRRMGVHRLSMILLTHPDLDHVGGLVSVLKAYPDATLAASAQFRDHPQMSAFLRAANVPLKKVLWLPRTTDARVGEWRMRFYCPPTTFEKDNEGSVFLHLSDGRSSAVLTGDAGIETETLAAGLDDWSAQVLKAGHHGSKFSLGNPWLRETKAKFTVFSAGVDNFYGHPSPEAMDRARSAGTVVLRTDRHGDIRFVATDQGFVRD